MQEPSYGLGVSVPLPYEAAVEQTVEALKREGFCVLTTIDVKDTVKKKLGEDFRKYVILIACHPPLANRTLHAEPEVGLLLPCNVIVYEIDADHSAVLAMAPIAAPHLAGENRAVEDVAREADERLRRVLTAVLARPQTV